MTDNHDNAHRSSSRPAAPREVKLEDHQAEMEAEAALEDLKRDLLQVSEKEYRRMAADLKWTVLQYCEQHPEMSVQEVADHFGIKEGSIRAWKAHLTMGTYQKRVEMYRQKTSQSPSQSFPQEKLTSRESPKGYVERKRYSNFIRFFDKTPRGIVCPHFYILAHANGCPHECQYCYLSLTLRHHPEPAVFSNTARMYQEVREWLMAEQGHQVLNTGELSDSLAWDDTTYLTSNLVPLFAEQTRHKLLLLTKSTNIANLRELEPTPQVIVSFSVNAPEVSARYEKKSPPPLARIKAAQELKALGWTVRLRLDPIIPLEGWAELYAPIIEAINETGPEVVTLGSLRFFPSLVDHARYGTEVFKYGVDNKDPDKRMRLPLEQRIEIYSSLLAKLETLRIGLCKETEEVHRRLGLPALHQSCNCTYE